VSANLTHWKKLTNPDYIGAYALEPGQELILTIKSVGREMVMGADGKKEECIVAHFTEDVKPMILNATNAKMITQIYKTPYIEEWAGKKIQVYAADVRAFGQDLQALRIRPIVPKMALEELTRDHPKWDGAVQAIKEKRTTIADIRKRYELSFENEVLIQEAANA
jgi:hypothetical protein